MTELEMESRFDRAAEAERLLLVGQAGDRGLHGVATEPAGVPLCHVHEPGGGKSRGLHRRAHASV